MGDIITSLAAQVKRKMSRIWLLSRIMVPFLAYFVHNLTLPLTFQARIDIFALSSSRTEHNPCSEH
jgi:hypothetical protein